jgi:hypothetical protein
MHTSWLIWSFIPGLHWVAWLHAGLKAKYVWYYAFGFVYALPILFMLETRALPVRYLLFSWLLCILHTYMQQHEVQRRIMRVASAASAREILRQALLQAALKHEGCLSVTQGVLETGRSFAEVESLLHEMATSGYIYRRNNPETGVIEYVFKEMP